MNTEFQLIFMGPDSVIMMPDGEIAVRIMAHLNPSLCDRGHLLNLNGRRFRFGSDLYAIRMIEGIVGYPLRMAVMATAIRITNPFGIGAEFTAQRLADVEKQVIQSTLSQFNGHRAKTAAALGIGLRTLGMKLKKWKTNES